MYELQLKCVTDLIRRECLGGGGLQHSSSSSSPTMALLSGSMLAAWGHFLLSTELHMAPHQEELNHCCCSLHVRTAV